MRAQSIKSFFYENRKKVNAEKYINTYFSNYFNNSYSFETCQMS